VGASVQLGVKGFAHCWGCAFQIPRGGGVDPPVPAAIGQVLGACFQCGVMGCSRHAERDRKSGKWLCFTSVANILSVSSGLDRPDAPIGVQLRTSHEFEDRFPYLARATQPQRRRWKDRSKDLPGMVLEHRPRLVSSDVSPTQLNLDLLADALGVGTFLLTETPKEFHALGLREEASFEQQQMHLQIIPGDLGRLLIWAKSG
jgi:hypothetical protein